MAHSKHREVGLSPRVVCSSHCSVQPVFEHMANGSIVLTCHLGLVFELVECSSESTVLHHLECMSQLPIIIIPVCLALKLAVHNQLAQTLNLLKKSFLFTLMTCLKAGKKISHLLELAILLMPCAPSHAHFSVEPKSRCLRVQVEDILKSSCAPPCEGPHHAVCIPGVQSTSQAPLLLKHICVPLSPGIESHGKLTIDHAKNRTTHRCTLIAHILAHLLPFLPCHRQLAVQHAADCSTSHAVGKLQVSIHLLPLLPGSRHLALDHAIDGTSQQELLASHLCSSELPLLPCHRQLAVQHAADCSPSHAVGKLQVSIHLLPLLPGHGHLPLQHAVDGTSQQELLASHLCSSELPLLPCHRQLAVQHAADCSSSHAVGKLQVSIHL